MNSRRKFMVMSAAAAAACMMPISQATASTDNEEYPDNIIYTQKNPGVWEKKAATHLPQVEVDGDEVVIRTLHPMTKEHYIVRHTFVDSEGNIIGAKTFANTDEKAMSKFKLPSGSKGKTFYATSFCNKHDFWVNKIKL